jgi:hypothetical protein
MFLKFIDASHLTKTDKIFEMIDQVVEEVGEENVVQIVIDNWLVSDILWVLGKI